MTSPPDLTYPVSIVGQGGPGGGGQSHAPGPGAAAGVAAQSEAASHGRSGGRPVRLYEDLATGLRTLTGVQADTDRGYLTHVSRLNQTALKLSRFKPITFRGPERYLTHKNDATNWFLDF